MSSSSEVSPVKVLYLVISLLWGGHLQTCESDCVAPSDVNLPTERALCPGRVESSAGSWSKTVKEEPVIDYFDVQD